MLNKVREYAKKNSLFDECGHVVAGLSGGADSVCLLDILCCLAKEMDFGITAVHVHHGIRGSEADRDMDFCKRLCEEKGVEFRGYRYDIPQISKETGESTEEAGRRIRYTVFNEVAAAYDRCFIAVAHHGNDRAETVVFNIIRGTGIKGICTMRPKRDNIIRPLLDCSRMEIEEYLKAKNMEYCNDSTNFSDSYARNKLRNRVIPYLEEINPAAIKNIGRMAERFSELEDFTAGIIEKAYLEYAVTEKDGILVKNPENMHPYAVKEIIIRAVKEVYGTVKDITDLHINRIYGLISKNTGAYINVKSGLTVKKEPEGLFFCCRRTDENPENEAEEVVIPSNIRLFDGRIISFYKILWDGNKKITNQVYTKYIDYDKIEFGLQLRTYRSGDYLIADGAGHSKKLNRYFIDEKIPQRKRGSIPLLADGSHIIWVIGYRISEYYKVTEETKTVLCVECGETKDV